MKERRYVFVPSELKTPDPRTAPTASWKLSPAQQITCRPPIGSLWRRTFDEVLKISCEHELDMLRRNRDIQIRVHVVYVVH